MAAALVRGTAKCPGVMHAAAGSIEPGKTGSALGQQQPAAHRQPCCRSEPRTRRVFVGWQREAQALQVAQRQAGRPRVRQVPSLAQQQHVVKHAEDGEPRLQRWGGVVVVGGGGGVVGGGMGGPRLIDRRACRRLSGPRGRGQASLCPLLLGWRAASTQHPTGAPSKMPARTCLVDHRHDGAAQPRHACQGALHAARSADVPFYAAGGRMGCCIPPADNRAAPQR